MAELGYGSAWIWQHLAVAERNLSISD